MKKFTATTFYKTATIVTLLSILERALGFLYRIALSQRLGEESLGVYQVAHSVFGVFLTIGVGGLPVTISRFIARSKADGTFQESQVLSSGFLLSFCLSALPALLFWLFGRVFSPILPDERCLPVLQILLVGSIFSSAFAVLRGSMWGNKSFLTPTLFELLEESSIVLSGIFFLSLKVELPLIERAAWATVFSSALAFLVAFFYFLKSKGKLGSPLPLAKQILGSAVPITAVRVCNSLLNSLIAILLPVMLVRAGENNAMRVYGVLSGMVIPVLFVPATLIGSLSLVLSPQLSENYYQNDLSALQKNVTQGLSATVTLVGVLLPAVYVLGKEIGQILFSSQLAGEMIQNGSPILLPMSLSMLSTTILNAIGFEKQTFRFYFVGALALLLSVLFLPRFLGAYAYLIGMGANFTLTAFCNLFFLRKHCPLKGGFYVHLLKTIAFLLPVSLFGQALKAFCLGKVHALLGVGIVGAGVVLFAVALQCLLFRESRAFFVKIFGKKQRK
ncbi:MAG: oligosaccharide flippase family protein [Clostridia bacterium]|nr:oligosaccharide flippase family protein [Clostridia bacterium]